MTSTLEQPIRPRPPKRKRSKFGLYVGAFVALAIIALSVFINQTSNVQKKEAAIRTDYTWGTALEVSLQPGDIATTFNSLQGKLQMLKDAGFSTLILPVVQTSDEVQLGEELVRAPSNWDTIDQKFGSYSELKKLVKAAHDNEQQVLLTLNVGWVSINNPWVSERPKWFVKPEQLKPIAKAGNIDEAELAKVSLPGGPSFASMAYFEIVSDWSKHFGIDGVYVNSQAASSVPLNGRVLDRIRREISNKGDFVVISSRSQTTSLIKMAYSAAKSDAVAQIATSIEKVFDPEILATNLSKNMIQGSGPKPIYETKFTQPEYLNAGTAPIGKLNFGTALAYMLPGVPIIESTELISKVNLKLYTELNNAFEDLQNNDAAATTNHVDFFVADEDGTAAFGITRNGKKSVLFINVNDKLVKDEKFEVAEGYTGGYRDLLTGKDTNFGESFKIDLQPFEIKLFVAK